MIEWVLAPIAIGAAGVISPKFFKMNDKQKIDRIFTNMGVCVVENEKKKFPVLFRKEKLDRGMMYVYRLPLGLPPKKIQALQEGIGVFSDGLNKPVEVEFDGMLQVNVYEEKLKKKYSFPDYSNEEWKVPIGIHYKGWIEHDFDQTPHMTVAGMTRFGKTVYLKNIVTHLIQNHPDEVEIYIIDLKGGLEFSKYEKLKQVKKVAKNPADAFLLLDELLGRIDNQYDEFLKNNWTNVVDSPYKKRTFIIVDEAASLAPEKHMKKDMKDLLGFCQFALSEVARKAGGIGYRLIFCTQYPTTDTMPRQIKQNSDAKITFRLPSGYASEVAIDDRGAETLPSDVPGRAIFKTHETKEIQVPFISDKEMWKRLEVYDTSDIIQYREEETETRKDTPDLESLGIFNKRATSNNSQSRESKEC